MSMNAAEIELILRHLAARCTGARVQDARPRGAHALVLELYGTEGKIWVLVSAHPRLSRIHTLDGRPEKGEATRFAAECRRRLRGARVAAAEAEPGDRRCRFRFEAGDAAYTLECELFGVGANLVLVAEDDRIVDCLRHVRGEKRVLLPGRRYEPPPAVSPRSEESRFGEVPAEADRRAREWFEPRQAEDDLAAARARVLARLNAALKRARGKARSLENAEQRLALAEQERRKGELLKANLPRLRAGAARARVVDYFDPAAPEIEISLDPKLSPAANAERCFKRYRKMKTAAERARRELPAARAALERLDAAARRVEAAAGLRQVEAIEREVFGPGRDETRDDAPRSGPRRFVSCDGFVILVGRNDAENAEVTFRLADGRDLWFHIQGLPGAHVVVKRPRGRSVPLETLLDAAALAKHYSAAREADAAEVDYTQRKYVRRRKRGRPGEADYWAFRTLRVGREEERLRRLFETSDAAERRQE